MTEPAALSSGQKGFLAIGFTVVLCLVLWATSSVFRGQGPALAEGARRVAPEVSLPLLSGSQFDLADYRGRTVILDFWATWCDPCEVQMPVLDTLYKDRHRDGLEIVGISVDTDPAASVEAWVKERGIEYPIALGDFDLAQSYGTIGFPSLFVIDPDGGIHTHHTGVLSRPELEEILDQIAYEARP